MNGEMKPMLIVFFTLQDEPPKTDDKECTNEKEAEPKTAEAEKESTSPKEEPRDEDPNKVNLFQILNF